MKALEVVAMAPGSAGLFGLMIGGPPERCLTLLGIALALVFLARFTSR